EEVRLDVTVAVAVGGGGLIRLNQQVALGDGDRLVAVRSLEDERVSIFAFATRESEITKTSDGDDLVAVAGGLDAGLSREAGTTGDRDAGRHLDELLATAAMLDAGLGGFAVATV